MHATRPLFFSARCVYVLVLNVRQTYEQNRVAYWLRTIRAFGSDAPVIVVGNQADVAQHVLDLPQNRLQREFPNIAAFLQTSAQENTGIESLRAALNEAAAALPHVRSQFAQTHLQVKAALEKKKQQENVISRQVYRQLCVAQGIQDTKEQDTLLLLLHDLGVVLDFRDEAGEHGSNPRAQFDDAERRGGKVKAQGLQNVFVEGAVIHALFGKQILRKRVFHAYSPISLTKTRLRRCPSNSPSPPECRSRAGILPLAG